MLGTEGVVGEWGLALVFPMIALLEPSPRTRIYNRANGSFQPATPRLDVLMSHFGNCS